MVAAWLGLSTRLIPAAMVGLGLGLASCSAMIAAMGGLGEISETGGGFGRGFGASDSAAFGLRLQRGGFEGGGFLLAWAYDLRFVRRRR